MPQKKHPAYIPNTAFRTTPEFSKLTEAEIADATSKVFAAYIANITSPAKKTDSWIDPDLSFTDPIEQEYHRLSVAYDTSVVENFHAFIRATPESDLSPIELHALANPFGGIGNAHEALANIDSWNATTPRLPSRKKKAPKA